MVTDINANVTQQVLYAPFGEVISESNAYWHNGQIPDFMFNAKELDEENGMYYYSARYYAPPVFTSRDPKFAEYPTLSPYCYTANNPVKFVDPDGKKVVLPSRQKAERVSNDLNRIYMAKYGADNAFAVNERNYNVSVRVNPRELLSPSTWFATPKYKTEQRTEYRIVGNSSFDWNTDKYTKAMADIMESNIAININIVPNHDGITLNRGREINDFVKDLGGGFTASSTQIYLSDGLSKFGEKGTTGKFAYTHTVGGVALHEMLYHVHKLGKTESGQPNKMRDHYNLAPGQSKHGAGDQQIIEKHR
jgi:RHS repeat-associated protein